MTIRELKNKIYFILNGIDTEDLTQAEKQILKILNTTY